MALLQVRCNRSAIVSKPTETAAAASGTRVAPDFDLFWLEYDNDSPEALRYIRDNANTQIASLETLIGASPVCPIPAGAGG